MGFGRKAKRFVQKEAEETRQAFRVGAPKVQQLIANQARQVAQNAGRKVIKFANKPAPAFLQQTLGRLPNFEKTTAPIYKRAAEINTHPLSSRVNKPIPKLAAMIVESPYTAVSSLAKIQGQVVNATNDRSIYTKPGAKKAMGQALEAALNVASVIPVAKGATALKAGQNAVTMGAVPKLSQIIRKSAATGAKIGTGYGAGYSVSDNLQSDEPKSAQEIIRDALKGGAMGFLAGGVLGGAIPAAGAVVKSVKDDVVGVTAKRLLTKDSTYNPYKQEFELPGKEVLKRTAKELEIPTKFGTIKTPGFEDLVKLPSQTKAVFEQIRKALPKGAGLSVDDITKHPLYQAAKSASSFDDVKLQKSFIDEFTDEKAMRAFFDLVKTGDEGIKAYVGRGGALDEAINGVDELGKGKYFSRDPEVAGKFGKVSKQSLNLKEGEILKINTQDDFDAFVKGALKEFPDMPLNEAQTAYAKARGFKAIEGAPEFDELAGLNVIDDSVLSPQAQTAKASAALDDFMSRGKETVAKGIENVKKELDDVPTFTRDEMRTMRDSATYLSEEGKPRYKEAFAKWIGKRDSAHTKGYKAGADLDIPEGQEMNVIRAIEGTGDVPPQASGAVKQIKGIFDQFYEKANKAGLDIPYLKNYITHIWEESPAFVGEVFKRASPSFKYARERTVPTYDEGIKLGLTPKYTNPKQIIGEYVTRLEQTLANIQFLDDLQKQGLVVPAGAGANKPGFFPIQAPGIGTNRSTLGEGTIVEGSWYAPDDIAKEINRVFSPEDSGALGSFFDKTAKASGFVQDVTLSGGIPKTPVNAFTVANMLKEWTTGDPRRMWSSSKSFMRSMSGTASDDFFKKNLGQIEKLQERNVPIRTTLNIDSLAEHGFWQKAFVGAKTGAGNRTASIWNKTMNEPTFKRFMSQLNISLFNDIEGRMLKNGMEPAAAADEAAKAVKNFYGIIGSDVSAARGKLGKDVASTFLFAPRYRESMINFWANNVKSVLTPGAIKNRENIKFSIGALAMFAGYDYANQKLNGRHLWENPDGKEDKLLIPGEGEYTTGVPFLSSIATMPRLAARVAGDVIRGDIKGAATDAVQTLSSSLTRPLVDIATNSNYFGEEIYEDTDSPGEKWKKIGLHLLGSYNHPYIRVATEKLRTDKPTYQVISQALELPFRFYKTANIEKSFFWDRLTELQEKGDRFNALKKDDMGKAKEYFEDNEEDLAELKEMRTVANSYGALKDSGDVEGANGLIQRMGNMLERENSSGGETFAAAEQEEKSLSDLDFYISLNKLGKYTGQEEATGIKKYTLEADKAGEARKIFQGSDTYKDLPEEYKGAIYERMGFTEEQVEYDAIAYEPDEAKAQYLMDEFENAGADHATIIEGLIGGRAAGLGGRRLASDGVLDTMYHSGLITDAEKKALKKIKIDKDGNMQQAASSGSGGGSGKKKATAAKASIKSLLKAGPGIDTSNKSVNAILKRAPQLPKIKPLSVNPTISVNLSGLDFSNPDAIVEQIKANIPTPSFAEAAREVSAVRGGGGSQGGSLKLSSSFYRGS